ncbi:hypothetical protein Tco_0465586 [Tanacetum coccineum]
MIIIRDLHVDNSSDLALSTSLNDLEIAALHIDGQSIDVDALPDIIDIVDEDDDIIDEEDPIPHDLANSDDEDLVNLDIDDGKAPRKPNLWQGEQRGGQACNLPETRNLDRKAIHGINAPPYPGQMPPKQKAGVMAKIRIQFDLRPHMESDCWPQIYAGIQQHLQKIYNDKKTALKERYWVPEKDETYDLERLRRGRPRTFLR